MTNARTIVEDVLSPRKTREIWTGNYEKALPISVQGFDLAAVLPAVFYMFRFGHRRGRGQFLEAFGPSETKQKRERRQAVTIDRIVDTLAISDQFLGFENDTGKSILGDLLLCYCLENLRHESGRDKQVQRVAPTHYMASWVDLPDSVANLRYVPEMIVSMLANQTGAYIHKSHESGRTWFAVGENFENNLLVSAFYQNMERCGALGSLTSDKFREEDDQVGLDQLLTIRLAQQLGEAPQKLRDNNRGQISNQHPIARGSAKSFSEDMRRFIRAYASTIPRHAFLEFLESCMAIGMTAVLSSTVEVLCNWVERGEISDQPPSGFLVDCSSGIKRELRNHSEASVDEFVRRAGRLPVILMALRLLDSAAQHDRSIRKSNIPTKPYATEWLNLLGALMHNRHPKARPITYLLDNQSMELAASLQQDYPDVSELLENAEGQPNPVWRLAEALTSLQGPRIRIDMIKMMDSILYIDHTNGIALKRATTQRAIGGTRRRREARSIILTDSALEYLVHLHLLRSGNKPGTRRLSFGSFIQKLRKRYGLYVDRPPLGMAVSNELLQSNRAMLERRLRDLGLLSGVNDAETMKRLQPRFNSVNGKKTI